MKKEKVPPPIAGGGDGGPGVVSGLMGSLQSLEGQQGLKGCGSVPPTPAVLSS